MTSPQEQLRNQIKSLREEIVTIRAGKTPSADAWNTERNNREYLEAHPLKVRKTLVVKGDGRVTVVDFGRNMDIMSLASGAMASGSIILWNTMQERKKRYIKCANSWMYDAAIDKVDGDLIACGGLYHDLYVYKVQDTDDPAEVVNSEPMMKSLENECPINFLTFMKKDQVVTAGGDRLVKLWDVHTGQITTEFAGHTGDVFCTDVNPERDGIILSGGGDFTARLWSTKEKEKNNQPRGGILYTFDVESRDANGVKWFPDGNCFATALNNSEVNLYDMRANCKLVTFVDPAVANRCGAETVCFSSSGRLMFVKYKNKEVRVYDVASDVMDDAQENSGTKSRSTGSLVSFGNQGEGVESVAVDSTGRALALGVGPHKGTDTTVKVLWPQSRR